MLASRSASATVAGDGQEQAAGQVVGKEAQKEGQKEGQKEAGQLLWAPRLLLQTDAVWLRDVRSEVATDAATAGGVDPGVGLYLRRARAGVDVEAGFWRGRLVLSAERAESHQGPRVPADPLAGPAEPAPGGWWFRPTEAYLGLAFHKAIGLWMGSMRVPIGLSRAVDEADLRLPERARIILRATPDFRVGAKLAGDLGLAQYALGVYSVAPSSAGALLGAPFSRAGPLTVARLSAEPVGPVGSTPWLRRSDDPWSGWWRFSLGVSAFHARLPGSNALGLGGDAQLQWARFCGTAELLWTHRGAMDRVGLVVEPGVFVWRDRLELVARGELFNDEIGPQSPADIWGAALGATWWSDRRVGRVQAAYLMQGPLTGDGSPTGLALVRLQLGFP